jgi:hypothetical protein
MNIKQYIVLALLLANISVQANPLASVAQFIKKTHADTAAAFVLPGFIHHILWDMKSVEQMRAEAEMIVEKDMSRRGIFTVEQLNLAYWIVDDATDADLQNYINEQKYLISVLTSVCCGIGYSFFRYSNTPVNFHYVWNVRSTPNYAPRLGVR